jgi:nicotinamidase-related amidase
MCIPGTEGHEIDIALGSGARIMVKEEHSCFSSRAFAESLAQEKVVRLIVCGFLAEYCVRATALDGLQKGYEVLLLEDAIGTGDDVQHRKENLFSELTAAGARLITSHSLAVDQRLVTRK